jgi:hypothetical protein
MLLVSGCECMEQRPLHPDGANNLASGGNPAINSQHFSRRDISRSTPLNEGNTKEEQP